MLLHQLSDAIGRKYSIHLAAAISAVFAAAGTACTTYWAWLAMRLLSGIGAAGTALGAYILATEAIGPSWRGAMGIYTQVRCCITHILAKPTSRHHDYCKASVHKAKSHSTACLKKSAIESTQLVGPRTPTVSHMHSNIRANQKASEGCGLENGS